MATTIDQNTDKAPKINGALRQFAAQRWRNETVWLGDVALKALQTTQLCGTDLLEIASQLCQESTP